MRGFTVTRSPGFTLLTPSPASTTSAENSWPRMMGPFDLPVKGWGLAGMMKGPLLYSCRSEPQIPQVLILTFTCPGPAFGSGTFSIRMSSFLCQTAAFMVVPPCCLCALQSGADRLLDVFRTGHVDFFQAV